MSFFGPVTGNYILEHMTALGSLAEQIRIAAFRLSVGQDVIGSPISVCNSGFVHVFIPFQVISKQGDGKQGKRLSIQFSRFAALIAEYMLNILYAFFLVKKVMIFHFFRSFRPSFL